METNVETLTIEIGASSEDAVAQIRNATAALQSMRSELNKKWSNPLKNMAGGGSASSKVRNTNNAMNSLREKIKLRIDASDADKAKKKVSGLATVFNSLKRIAFYRAIRTIIKSISSAIEEGAENAYWFAKRFGDSTKYIANSLDNISTKSFTMKNQLGASWATLLATLEPIITKIIGMIQRAVEVVTQFFALLGGKSTYMKAIDYTKAYADAAASGAEETKEWKNQLMGFDEINRLDEPPQEDEGGGGGDALDYSKMFEEAPIDAFTGIMDKLKNLITDQNIKIIWDDGLEGLVESFKYATSQIRALLQAIADDFLAVFNSGRGAESLWNIFNILKGILDLIGILADRFRTAWETNEIGKRILENIWDTINSILGLFSHLIDVTKEWAKTLDFYPLLESVEKLTGAFKNFVAILAERFAWEYEHVLLPFAKWVIEDAGPASVRLLASVIDYLAAVLEATTPIWKFMYENIWYPIYSFLGGLFVNAVNKLASTFESLTSKIRSANSLEEFLMSLDGKEITLVSLATAVYAVATAFAEWKAIKTIISGVTSALKLLTSPVGTAIIVVAALTAGFIALYQRSEYVRDIVDKLIERFKEFAEKVGDYFKEFEGLSFVEALTKVFSDLAKEIQSIDWHEVGNAIWNVLKEAFHYAMESLQNVFGDEENKSKFSNIVSSFFELLGSAFGAAAALVHEIAKNIWESLKDALQKVFDSNGDGSVSLKEIGEAIMNGIYEGMKFVLMDVGGWIIDHIWKPFVEGVKKAFGIHSPAETMEPIGQNILEGILEGIKAKLPDIGEIIEDIKAAFEPLKQKFEEIKESIIEKWTNIKTSFVLAKADLQEPINGIKEFLHSIGEKFREVQEGISKKWTNIKTDFVLAKNDIKGHIENIKTFFQGLADKWANIKKSISDRWDEVKDSFAQGKENLNTYINGIKEFFTNLGEKWTSVKETMVRIWTNIKTEFALGKDEIKSRIDSIKNFFGELGDKWEEIKSGIAQKWDEIKSKFEEGKADIDEQISKIQEFFGNLKDKFEEVKNTIEEKWTNIKTAFVLGKSEIDNQIDKIKGFFGNLSQKWEDVKTNISNAWDNIKSFFSGGKRDVSSNLGEMETSFGSLESKWGTVRSNIGQNLTGFIRDLWDTNSSVGSALNSIGQFFWNLYSNAYSAIQGIVNFLDSLFEAAANTVRQLNEVANKRDAINTDTGALYATTPEDYNWAINGGWNSGKKHALGGFPEDGLFFANHTELVGRFSNGRTAVANNEQIIAGITAGVYEGVVAGMSNSGGGSDQPVNIYLDGKIIAQSTTRYQRQFARAAG